MSLTPVSVVLGEGRFCASSIGPTVRRVSSSDWRRLVLSPEGPKGSSCRLVLCALMERMRPDGSGGFPSHRTLAVMTGLSRPTVAAALASAEGQGWVLVFRSGRNSRGRVNAHLYSSTVPVGVCPGEVVLPGQVSRPSGFTSPGVMALPHQAKPLGHIPSYIPSFNPLSAGSLAPLRADSPAGSESGGGAGAFSEAGRPSFAAEFRARFGSAPR